MAARGWQHAGADRQLERPGTAKSHGGNPRAGDLGWHPCGAPATLVGVLAVGSGLMPAALPLATYRLQLSSDCGFEAAARLVPYLKALGITHLYASPFLKARPGS